MRPIRETISLEEARALILEIAAPIERTERVAAGRCQRTRDRHGPRSRPMDVPPFDRAAMDGYAVRAEDTFGAGRYDPKVLRLVEKVYTGQVAVAAVGRGRVHRDRDRRADAATAPTRS